MLFFAPGGRIFFFPKGKRFRPPILFSPGKRERAAWRSKRKAPGGVRVSAPPEDEDGPLDPLTLLGEGASL